MGLNGQKIVCFASSSWEAMWVNPQHLMSRLSKTNKVLYVNNIGMRPPGGSRADIRKMVERLRGFLRGLLQPLPNLWVHSPVIFPFARSNPTIQKLNDGILLKLVRRYMRRLKFDEPILWVFLPTAAGMMGKLSEKLVVYHCVDDYSANPGVDPERIRELEMRLLEHADIVFVTSNTLYEDKKKVRDKDIHLFENVVDVEHFVRLSQDAQPPDDMKNIPKPTVGYQGNISSYKTDLALIEHVARARPDWSVVLVGPVGWGDPNTDVGKLETLKNVYLLGRKGFDELPAYIASFDVCIIPFRVSESTQKSFPMKLFEYLACGRPVVSTALEPIKHYLEDPQIGGVGHDYEGFVNEIARFLNASDDDTARAKRAELAKKFDWARRTEQIGEVVRKKLEERGRL